MYPDYCSVLTKVHYFHPQEAGAHALQKTRQVSPVVRQKKEFKWSVGEKVKPTPYSAHLNVQRLQDSENMNPEVPAGRHDKPIESRSVVTALPASVHSPQSTPMPLFDAMTGKPLARFDPITGERLKAVKNVAVAAPVPPPPPPPPPPMPPAALKVALKPPRTPLGDKSNVCIFCY